MIVNRKEHVLAPPRNKDAPSLNLSQKNEGPWQCPALEGQGTLSSLGTDRPDFDFHQTSTVNTHLGTLLFTMEQLDPSDPFLQLFRTLILILGQTARHHNTAQELLKCREDVLCSYEMMIFYAPVDLKCPERRFLLAKYGNTTCVEDKGELYEAQ